jgi:nucleoside-diphosphate-sugar epimerase
VIAVRRASPAPVVGAGIRWVTSDLVNDMLPTSAVADVDAVLHLAGHRYDERAPAAAYRTGNVDATARLLDAVASRAAPPPPGVLFSSIYVSGERSTRPLTEDDRPAPRTAYGNSKLEAEEVVRERCARAGIPFTILRLAAVCGTDRPDVLRQMAAAYARLGPFVIGDGRQERSLLEVANLARVVRMVLDDPRWRGATVNVADPRPYRMIDLARRVAGPRPVRHVPQALVAVVRAFRPLVGPVLPAYAVACDRLGRLADSFALDTARLERMAREGLARAPLLGV